MQNATSGERVDIIDEQERILYQTTKEDAHEKGLLHKCVIAEVIDSAGNWLFVEQSSTRQEPGKLVSPMGGHVQSGEPLEEALRRELKEELGITNYTFKFKGKCIYDVFVKNRQENHYFMVYEVFSDQQPQLSHEASRWVKYSKESLRQKLNESPELFGNAFFPIVKNLYPELLEKEK